MNRAFIQRDLPLIVFTGVDDVPRIINMPITPQRKPQPENTAASIYNDKSKSQSASCKHNAKSNKERV